MVKCATPEIRIEKKFKKNERANQGLNKVKLSAAEQQLYIVKSGKLNQGALL